MAGLEGLGKDDLKRVLDIRAAVADVKSEISTANKEFKKLGLSVASVNSEISKITAATKGFADLQDEAAKSAKATAEAIKGEAKQLAIVRTLNIQINELTNKAIGANEKQAKLFTNQAQRLSSVRDSAQGLAGEFGKIADSSSKLDKGTMWFTAFSDFTKDVPGLRVFSGPFEAAAKASRETLISNAKIGALQDQIKDTVGDASKIQKLDGRTLTKEKLKQLKLDNITEGLTGKAAKDKLSSTLSANKSASSGIAGMKAGFKGLKGIISKAIAPLAIITAISKAIQFVVGAMTAASKQTAKFSNDLLISREAANELRNDTYETVKGFNLASKAAGGVAITQEGLLKTMDAINKKLGFQVNILGDFGGEMRANVAEATMMSEKFGLSADASARLFLESVKTGKPLKEMTKEYFGQVGFLSSQEGLTADVIGNLEEATKVSGNLRANFRGSSFAIADGIFNAKRLGFELNQMEGISSSMLDFQSSIESEMEAELLTGKQLNLEKAREYALMGQTGKLMEEISEQAGTQEEFLAMNIVQRQSLAKAVGLEVNALADMFDKKDKNDALAEANLKKINELKAAGLNIDDKTFDLKEASLQEIRIAAQAANKTEAELREILGDQIYLRKSEQSATEKFNEQLSRAKDIFASFVEGGALDRFASFIDSFATSPLLTLFGGRADTEFSQKMKNDEAADFISRPGQPIQKFRKDDVIVGGTSLGGGGNREVTALLKELIVAVKEGGDVYMDGNKVGKSLALVTSNMG
tara:strand:- start:7177 stop:9450 length:2274 start_codon:yes stop_codon:yes gene_type:complete